MPYSKVGVMPELMCSKDAKGSQKSRNNRPKGITMEDLKKQTALRLAQEHTDPGLQQQIHVDGNSRQQQLGQFDQQAVNDNHAFSLSNPTVPYGQQPQDFYGQQYDRRVPDGTSINHVNNGNENRPLNYSISHEREERQQNRNHQQLGGYLGVSNYNHMNSMPPQDQNTIPPGLAENHLMGSHHTSNYTQYVEQQTIPCATQPLQPTSTICLPSNSMYFQQQQPFMSYSLDEPRPSTIGVGVRVGANNMKSKLPHGLTVHELKEMTKARLQSEAAEKSNDFHEIQAVSRDRVSPLDFDSGEPPLRDRAMSRDSSSTGRMNSNHVTSYFQNHQVAPKTVQTQHQPQPQISLPNYNPTRMVGGSCSPFRAARNDTWESTSVVSHNTIYSDNLGSESASEVGSFGHQSSKNRSFTYPVVQNVQSLDTANTPATPFGYKESRSFSNPSPVQASPHRGSGVLGGQPLFNAAVGGNRRRAVTLSPNYTGSILEDRPLRYDAIESSDRLDIPNFSSVISDTSSLSVAPANQNLQRGYSPVLEQLGLGLDNSYVSNGTDSSSVFRNMTMTNRSPLPGISQMGSNDQDSIEMFSSRMKNMSDVFRPSTTKDIRATAPPPGFLTSRASPSDQTAFSRVGSLDGYCNGDRKIGWQSKSNFQINQSHRSPEETMIDDFGSVLNLSGSGRRDRERANTYTFGSNQPRNYHS